ncbi:MAG: N-acetyltransferase family protein [Alphaproteobacteria bacterium]|nr:N-acetyltransferase family protein [Alphaproteobacteria bacterium]
MIGLRPAREGDLEAARAIYDHHARTGIGTFDEEAPPFPAFKARWQEIAGSGLPYLVAEEDGAICGYAYAAPFRARPAYRYTLEDSIYVHKDWLAKGVGRQLLEQVLREAEHQGAREMLALIGGSENAASIGLHRACGFHDAGLLKAVGWKFGRWLDVVILQRSLNAP